jgi:hypothetical protein
LNINQRKSSFRWFSFLVLLKVKSELTLQQVLNWG